MEMDVDIKSHSKAVYSALCEVIGNEDDVEMNRISFEWLSLRSNSSCCKTNMSKIVASRMRRYIGGLDILSGKAENVLSNMAETLCMDNITVTSGSRAEGFDFSSSDIDLMAVMTNVKVIQNHTEEYPSQSYMLLYAEKDNTRPGFVRLKVLHTPPFCAWEVGCIEVAQNIYMSSSKLLQAFSSIACIGVENNVHGPCINTTLYGKELDSAITFSSEMWPVEAAGCVHRLFKHRWPSDDVIKDMVSDGCLFVPIGCKTSPYADVEWRMSFSLAEKRLVHSMNHTQFLTYGLLKLFLKEVVEVHYATKGLLCSYFIKTLVFWEIIDTKVSWTPSCLLQNVWSCFRRLLKWICNKYCPNFFIPENNMFFGKIHGRSRRTLLDFLSSYYRAGYLTFVEIPSIRKGLDRRGTLQGQIISHGPTRSKEIQKIYLITRMCGNGIGTFEALLYFKSNFIVECKEFFRLFQINLSYFKILCCKIFKVCHNRTKYLYEKSIFRLIKLSSLDCVRSKIFLAIYFYRCKRYDSCVRLLHKAIRKMEDARTINMWEYDPDKYSSLGGDDFSISEGIYKFTAFEVPLDSETCIPEILDECNAIRSLDNFQILSPWMLSHFLLCLCNFWTGDLTQARVHLENIRDCLQNRRQHISKATYPLSWQILGIGQEILGDYQDALISYGECNRCMDIAQRLYFFNLIQVNMQRSSRLMSLLSSPRAHREQISKPRHWRSRRHPRTQRH